MILPSLELLEQVLTLFAEVKVQFSGCFLIKKKKKISPQMLNASLLAYVECSCVWKNLMRTYLHACRMTTSL